MCEVSSHPGNGKIGHSADRRILRSFGSHPAITRFGREPALMRRPVAALHALVEKQAANWRTSLFRSMVPRMCLKLCARDFRCRTSPGSLPLPSWCWRVCRVRHPPAASIRSRNAVPVSSGYVGFTVRSTQLRFIMISRSIPAASGRCQSRRRAVCGIDAPWFAERRNGRWSGGEAGCASTPHRHWRVGGIASLLSVDGAGVTGIGIAGHRLARCVPDRAVVHRTLIDTSR